MRKIVCGCGCASFIRLNALFDTTDTELSKDLMAVEKVFAYKCSQCGNEYTTEEIESFIVSSMELEGDKIKIYREYD